MYLEAILQLKNEIGHVRSIDIAKKLNYSKPSVSRAIRLLEKAGYLTRSSDGELQLTRTGQADAERVFHAHLLLTEFFVQTLKLPKEIAEEDACRVEHVISKETLDAIEKYLQKK
jgi:Mn-dependent DtxR family transcriptional regulator